MEQPPRPDLSPTSTAATVGGRSRDELAARIVELEALCADILGVSAEAALPLPLLQRLRAVVGRRAAQPGDDPMPIPDIRLSSSPAAAPGDGAPGPELRPLPTRRTVLVVDDDPMMLNVLGRILERENFELLLATSGPEALRALDERGVSVDLLVTDYAMPGMQGRELADRVRQRCPGLRVLYQTGFSDLLFDNCVELEEGAAFIEKPFTARGLREAARLVLFGALNPA